MRNQEQVDLKSLWLLTKLLEQDSYQLIDVIMF